MSAIASIGSLGEVHIVHVRGELDASSSEGLRSALVEAIARPPNPVVVDLTGVDFIDSTALSLLLQTQRRLLRQGRGIAVVAAPGPVRRVFELTLLHETLCVSGTVPEAVAAASRPVPPPETAEEA